jgi:hypothetical protein
LLGVLYLEEVGTREVAVVGAAEHAAAMERVYWEKYRPDCIIAVGTGEPGAIPLLEDRQAPPGAAAAHVCRNFTCDLPVFTPAELRAKLS